MKNLLSSLCFLSLGLEAALADLVPYMEDFESLDALASDPDFPLGDAGWLVYGNAFANDGVTYIYGYGPFTAPNLTAGFCSISTGQGGAEQGAQGLVVYSDYNNGDQSISTLNYQIEANVFQEWTVGAADVGTTWTFKFDAKKGDLVAPSSALAFIKTIDPGSGFATTNFLTVDTTGLPVTWETYQIRITIDSGLVGQLLQVGFAATANNFVASGVYYDNVSFLPPGGFPPTPKIEVLSFSKTGDVFAITFVAEIGETYELQKYDPLLGMWEYVLDLTASSTTEVLDDIAASDPAAIYQIIQLTAP